MAQNQWNGEHTWTVGEPITQEKMNSIEGGIANLYERTNDDASQLTTLDNRLDRIDGGTALSGTYTLAQQVNQVTQKAENALSEISTIHSETADGQQALSQIQGALSRGQDQEPYASLADRLDADKNAIASDITTINSNIQSATTNIGLISDEITGARGQLIYNGNSANASNLRAKLDDMDAQIQANRTQISINQGSISSTRDIYNAAAIDASGYDHQTLQARLNHTDDVIDGIKDEIEEARSTYDDLDARFDADETAIANLQTAKINVSDIVDNLNQSDINKPLSAKQGNVIKQMFGTGVGTTQGTTVTELISTAQSNAESNAESYADTNKVDKDDIYNGVDHTANDQKVLDARVGKTLQDEIDTINSNLNTADTGLVARITANESAITTLNGNASTSGSVLNTVNSRIAEVVDEAPEAFDTLKEIADWIGNNSDDALTMQTNISNNASAIGALDTRLDAIDGGEALTGATLASRVSTAEGNIDALETAVGDNNSGLTQAVNILQTTIGDNNSGLTQRIGTLETTVGDNSSGLVKRVHDLETEPKSATVIVSSDKIVYSGNPEQPIIYTDSEHTTAIDPTEDVDYLLQRPAPDNKYYYWKYIGQYPNGTWNLISGGGGSGSGNSNAEDYNSFAAFEIATKEVNKDYYVLQDDNIRHHYRYLRSIGTNDEVIWTRIEIGIPTSMLKSYQIARSQVVDQNTNTSTEYLDLYGFDFGTNVTSENVDTVPNYETYRIARVELPKGGEGGGSSAHRIYAKVRGDQAQRIAWSTAQNNGVRINYGYTCYSFNDIDGYDYVSLQGTLTDQNNNVIETYNVPYLEYADYTAGITNITTKNLLQYCTKNETRSFTLTLHANIPNETIPDKTITVSITLVELALTSTFSDQQTYSINNNLTIPYEFTGMSDQSPAFEILFDNSAIAATITSTNIVIRKESLANKKGIHNLIIRASQLVGGSTLYSDPLTYQLGLTSGIDDTLMLFSGVSLQTLYNEQYKLLKLPYYLYVPNEEEVEVSFTGERLTYNDSNIITNREIVSELNRPTETLTTGAYTYPFRLHDMIADIEYYAITITAGNQSLVFYITMNKAAEQINIKTDNLMFDFKPERYSNNVDDEALRLWSDTNNGITYKMRIPEGAHFDWRTGGWMTIDDVPCFCVKAGSRVEFVQESNGNTSPLTLFWRNMETLGGSNFKCTFKIDNVKTPNTPFLTSLDTVTNTIVNYGKTILASKQDLEDDETLLHTYLNTKYIYTATINSSNKTVKEAIGMTVLNSNPFDNEIDNTIRAEAEVSARNSNKKKIKKYISNIYDIANQASTLEHREYLLKVLSGKANDTTIDYSTIKNEITAYLFDEASYDAVTATNTNAVATYNRLVSESNDTTSITYAYRQVEPVNFDALLNGFVVEGKDGKDGINAMILFTFASTIKTGGTYTQTVSATPISTNSFDKTGTFEVQVTDTVSNETKTYEVDVLDEEGNGHYTEIVSIKDASNTETRAYGLELNALGSNIYLPSGVVSYAHSEGDVIEFEYNVNPEISGRVNSSIIIYEDGVPSAAKLYTSRNNIFEQNNPGCLTIGSDECDVYIYKMRLYSQALNNEDILANFYADGLTTDDMMDRYNRNKNLVNAAIITPQLVASECPDLRVIMIEAPNLTGGKTSFIKNTKIRQIYKNGRPEDNWVALNAYHAGQGTSSDNYGVAGRNLDIMFGFDGIDTVIVPKPQKNNYTFDPNYKSILITGLDEDLTNDILTAEEYEDAGYNVAYNGTGKVSFTPTSVPNNWFNIKVNIASSENTNNAFLQKRFDRYLPYETPAMKRDSKIKNDMEFFNCVIFIKETGTPSEFTEDSSIAAADRPWHFYGIGNIGDSKKTDITRVNVEGDPYEFCIEISDNGLKNSGFSSGVYYISETSKIRSQTPRNQTNGNADLDIIRTATSIHVCESNEFTENGSSYTFSIIDPDDLALYLVPVVTDAFTYYRRFMHISATWTEVGEPITFTRTSYGIKYPISNAEWTCSLNDYHKSLYDTTSGKGWDKSFEFRYDITTKDGETVARNDLEAAMNELHQQINKKAFADMYSWIVTATDEEFKNEFNTRAVNATSRWFIKESPLYWYLFTERYTMIDSRAKNTFYHYGKVFISQAEYDGDVVTELTTAASDPAAYATVHNITANGNVTAEAIAAEEIQFRLNAAQFIYEHRDTFTLDDTQAAINDGYRFELWDYDDDTALGINNNGQMVFSAGLEDIDKDVSGWIYNEAESVIWRRIRENTYDDLGALYVRLKGEGFNAENLIQEFDTLQAQFPEELWRLDFERKYYRPFITKGETTYLNDMANGRKKYQRRQFERNMAIYINSKYQRNGSYDPTDIISFRPQFTWTAGRDTNITIKPYSTMYINFMLGNDDNTGNDTIVSTRVERGEPYTINAADYIHDFNNIQCIIYNASRIMELDGLGNFECKQFILGAGKKLSVLKLGSAEYPNRSMADINNMGLSDGLPLLEELDLTNIQFGTAPDTFALDNFPLLKKLNATGCNIRSFTFKEGGMLENIIFPSSLTKIEFKNLYNLVDTYNDNEELVSAVTLTGAANLTSYNSINSYSNSYQIVQNMLNNAGLNRIIQLKLNDIEWTIGNINELDPLVELQTKLQSDMQLSGIIHVTGSWSIVEKDYYAGKPTSIWPNITLTTIPEQEQIKYSVVYQYNSYINSNDEVVPPQKIKEIYVDANTRAPDIYYTNLIDLPTRNSTIKTKFSFGETQEDGISYLVGSGWKSVNSNTPFNSLDNPGSMPIIKNNTTIETYFHEIDREYYVRWLMDPEDRNRAEGEKRSIIFTSSDSVKYEGGENLNIPNIQDIHKANQQTSSVTINDNGTASYRIFKGWEKLPINITPDGSSDYYDIYASWETKENEPIVNIFADTTTLSPEQLLVLSGMSNEQKTEYNINNIVQTGKRFEMTLGQDSIEQSTNLLNDLTSNSAPLRLDLSGSTAQNTTIAPMTSTNDAFTIMIDYTLNENYSSNGDFIASIIMGCYYQNSNQDITNGFALYHNYDSNLGELGVRVGYGEMFENSSYSRLISTNSTSESRNVVVLRHPAESDKLYIYSGLGTGSSLANTVQTLDPITWNNSTSNATIYFGALNNELDYNNNPNSQFTIAKSIIYKAQYWNKDLGSGECQRLAAWPHETMTYIVSNITNNATDGVFKPSIGLTTLTASSHGRITQDTSTFGWGGSTYETICNNRVLFGLPIKMQAILARPQTKYRELQMVHIDAGNYDQLDFRSQISAVTNGDYIYFPSIYNLVANSTYSAETQNVNYETAPFSWLDSSNLSVYQYTTSTDTNPWNVASGSTSYLNIRFQIKDIKFSGRVFKANDSLTGNIFTEIKKFNGTVNSGDIFISNDSAYMYITGTEMNTLGLKVNNTGAFSIPTGNLGGGWIRARDYWLRSMRKPENQFGMYSQSGQTAYVTEQGEVITVGSTNVNPNNNGLYINYSMAI